METEKKGINPRIMSARTVVGGKCGCDSCKCAPAPTEQAAAKKKKPKK